MAKTPRLESMKSISATEALRRRQKDGLLDCCCDTAILDRFLRYRPRDLLHTAYTYDAIDYEPSVEVLQWWMDSGLELSGGRIYVLQWWKDSGLALKYDEWAVRNASKCGQIDVLQWWKDSGLQMKAVDWASEAGLTNVLQWWKDSGLEFLCTQDAMKGASYRGQTETLQWWKESVNGSVQSAAWSKSDQSVARSFAQIPPPVAAAVKKKLGGLISPVLLNESGSKASGLPISEGIKLDTTGELRMFNSDGEKE
ncbi:hypothetical protein DFJ73DRAFT_798013 [Zopfochytrium polystomum]|nr:hypothetical protein DFJ73DRAFT_798013 [Zopfochytrium polystomum]